MKKILEFLLFLTILIFTSFDGICQSNKISPRLEEIGKSPEWKIENREVTISNGMIYLNAQSGNGIVWHEDIEFSNGIIEVDLKGKDVNGESFIGIAFHVQNDSTYEAIYFRPFNFQNLDRKEHAVQYISHPNYTWNKLRSEHPGIYESGVYPIPDPNEWFNARIEVIYPEVKVFINDSSTPSLVIKQINKNKAGMVGLWVGNNSDGDFKNLSIQSIK